MQTFPPATPTTLFQLWVVVQAVSIQASKSENRRTHFAEQKHKNKPVILSSFITIKSHFAGYCSRWGAPLRAQLLCPALHPSPVQFVLFIQVDQLSDLAWGWTCEEQRTLSTETQCMAFSRMHIVMRTVFTGPPPFWVRLCFTLSYLGLQYTNFRWSIFFHSEWNLMVLSCQSEHQRQKAGEQHASSAVCCYSGIFSTCSFYVIRD